MIVYGNHEVPDGAQMMAQLVDMLWFRAKTEQEVVHTVRDLQEELRRVQTDLTDSEFRLYALDEKYGKVCGDLTLMEARAIAAEQDRDSWKRAYDCLAEEYVALLNSQSDGMAGKRPVDPFGKDGAYGGLGGTQSG